MQECRYHTIRLSLESIVPVRPSLRCAPFRLVFGFEKMKMKFGKLKPHEVNGILYPHFPAFPLQTLFCEPPTASAHSKMGLWLMKVPRTLRLCACHRAKLLFSEHRRYNAQNLTRCLAPNNLQGTRGCPQSMLFREPLSRARVPDQERSSRLSDSILCFPNFNFRCEV